MSDTDDSPCRLASDKLYDSLKGYFWTSGGFLQAVGVAEFPESPEESYIVVYLTRKLRPNEERLVPDRIDGFSVVKKVIGKMTIGG